MRSFLTSSFLTALCMVPAFGQDTVDVSAYYFPYQELTEPKVYQYQMDGRPMYWLMSFDSSSSVFTTEVYDERFILMEKTWESISEDSGAEFTRYSLYSQGQEIEGSLSKGEVYAWSLPTGSEQVWEVKHQFDAHNSHKTQKTRTFTGQTTFMGFGDKRVRTIIFNDTYDEVIIREDEVEFKQSLQQTYYSEGIGILRYDRSMQDGTTLTAELRKILSLADWQSLKEEAVKK